MFSAYESSLRHRDSAWRAIKLWAGTLALVCCAIVKPVYADSAAVIDAGVDDTLALFKKDVVGGADFLDRAAGVLVFPKVIKGGFGIGGEYGEGALRVGGQTVQYYNTAAASVGLQFGVQSKSFVIVFQTQAALDQFRNSEGWQAGVDGSIAIAKWGEGESITSLESQEPVIGFVIGNKGFMYNLTVEGSKFTRINR
ncbi:MAG: YSC84-related protein [Pseudomonadota bacterium]